MTAEYIAARINIAFSLASFLMNSAPACGVRIRSGHGAGPRHRSRARDVNASAYRRFATCCTAADAAPPDVHHARALPLPRPGATLNLILDGLLRVLRSRVHSPSQHSPSPRWTWPAAYRTVWPRHAVRPHIKPPAL